MSIKITIQNGSVLVRRWLYNKERKRTLPTTIMSIATWKMPDTFSLEQITDFNLTSEECATYEKYVEESKAKTDVWRKKSNVTEAVGSIKDMIRALSDPDAQGAISDAEVEILSDNANELKKLVTAIKTKRKRKVKKEVFTVSVSVQ